MLPMVTNPIRLAPTRNFRECMNFFIEPLPLLFLGSVSAILIRTVAAIAVEGIDRHSRLGGCGLHSSLADENAVIFDDDLRWRQRRCAPRGARAMSRDEIADASLEFMGRRGIALCLAHGCHDLFARGRKTVKGRRQARRPAVVLVEALAHPGRIGAAIQYLVAAANRLEGFRRGHWLGND